MNQDEIQLYNTLRRLNTDRQAVQSVRPYAERFIRHSNIRNKKKARNTIKKALNEKRLLRSTDNTYQRFLAANRGDGFRATLRPIVDALNMVLPQPIMAAHGFKSTTNPHNIRITLHNTQTLLPGINGSHLTFIRTRLNGHIKSTHFTFDFPDTWAREPIIPENAKDLRVGIDLNDRVFINYRIDKDKQPPIPVPQNMNNIPELVNYFYNSFVRQSEGTHVESQARQDLTTTFNQIHHILQLVQNNILNNPQLTNLIVNVQGGKKSKKVKKTKKVKKSKKVKKLKKVKKSKKYKR